MLDLCVLDHIYAEHGKLVDKSFTKKGLTPGEATRLKELEQILEQAEAPIYEPVIAKLEVEVVALEKKRDEARRGKGGDPPGECSVC